MEFCSCIICGSSKVKLDFTMSQRLVGNTTKVNILLCASCNMRFCYPRPDLEVLSRYYNNAEYDAEQGIEYYKKIKTLLSYGGLKEAEHFVRQIKKLCSPPAKLLDVASGHGWHLTAAKKAGYEIQGLEVSESALKICYEAFGVAKTEAQQGLFEDLPITQKNSETYDIVLMSQVLEHTLDPISWIKKACLLTKPNGVIAIGVPNHGNLEAYLRREKYSFFCPPEHLNYFSEESIRQFSQQFPLKLEMSYTRNYFAFSSLMNSSAKRAVAYGINLITDKVLPGQGRYLYALFRKLG